MIKIDYEKTIINQKSRRGYADYDFIEACMKEAIRHAIPIILKDIVKHAEIEVIYTESEKGYINEDSILNREKPLKKLFEL